MVGAVECRSWGFSSPNNNLLASRNRVIHVILCNYLRDLTLSLVVCAEHTCKAGASPLSELRELGASAGQRLVSVHATEQALADNDGNRRQERQKIHSEEGWRGGMV